MDPDTGSAVDPAVSELMREIEERVARKRAAGLYSVEALQGSNARDDEPFLPDELVEVAKVAEITVDVGVTASTKPGVGKAVGKVKEGLVRATSQPLRDVADRSTAFNLALLSYVTQLSQEVVALRAEVKALRGGGGGGENTPSG
jgi:hypothetical protein